MRVAEDLLVDVRRQAGRKPVHVHAKDLDGLQTRLDLEPGLDVVPIRDEKDDPAVYRAAAQGCVVVDGESHRISFPGQALRRQSWRYSFNPW